MTKERWLESRLQSINGKRVSECNPRSLKELIRDKHITIENGIVRCSIENLETKKFLKNADALIRIYDKRERLKRKKC